MGKTLGARIAELRLKKEMTQDEFGEALHVSRSVIAKWENDERDIKASDVDRIAAFFDVSCDYLIRGVSEKNRTLSEDLGLSEIAIDSLSWFVESKQKEATELFCDMVSDWDFFSSLAYRIEKYISKERDARLIEKANRPELLPEEKKELLRQKVAFFNEGEYALLSAYEYSRLLVDHIIKLRLKEVQRHAP